MAVVTMVADVKVMKCSDDECSGVYWRGMITVAC